MKQQPAHPLLSGTLRMIPAESDPHTASACTLQACWRSGDKLASLPPGQIPVSRSAAYQAQQALVAGMGGPVAGWKIAATSAAGQQHIGVQGPLAGQVLAYRVLVPGSTVTLAHNIMRVAEAEFVLTLAHALPVQTVPLAPEQVLACLGALTPAIEVPDSRFRDFTRVGALQLIAENACADWFVLGTPAAPDWRGRDLAAHAVRALRNGTVVAEGAGHRVLGDPLLAATWLANELRAFGMEWQPGQWVATGTCLTPVPVSAGDAVRMDFGVLGDVSAHFA